MALMRINKAEPPNGLLNFLIVYMEVLQSIKDKIPVDLDYQIT